MDPGGGRPDSPQPCYAQTYDITGRGANPVTVRPRGSDRSAPPPPRCRVAATQPGCPWSVEQTPPAGAPQDTWPVAVSASSERRCAPALGESAGRAHQLHPRCSRKSSSRALSVLEEIPSVDLPEVEGGADRLADPGSLPTGSRGRSSASGLRQSPVLLGPDYSSDHRRVGPWVPRLCQPCPKPRGLPGSTRPTRPWHACE